MFSSNFKCLLNDVTDLLKHGVEKVAKSKLGQYPFFFKEVKEKLYAEIERNEKNTETFLNIIIDINKRVVNTEHPSFEVIGNLKKKRIR